MHIAKLLDPLLGGADIEVIVASLPERPFAAAQSNGQFERVNRIRDCTRERVRS
jgi:hypothetical protein